MRTNRPLSNILANYEYKSKHYLEVINDFTRALLYANTEDDILWMVATKAVGRLDLDDCVVYLINKEKQVCIQKAAFGPKMRSAKVIKNTIQIPIGEGIVGNVALTGKAVIVNDTSKNEDYIVDDANRLSEIAVPIIIDDEVIGVIDSENSLKDFYNKEHLSILTTIAAITSTKLAQANDLKNFQRANAELERVQKEKTTELLRSNEELKRYAFTAAHDLKSPVRIVSGQLSILKKKIENGETDEVNSLIAMILENTTNMNELIDGVLEHAVVEKKDHQNEEVDINVVVSDLIHRYTNTEDVIFSIPNELPVIQARRIMIYQIFQNLISNAIQYNNKSIGRIEIRSETINGQHLFMVQDNGMGIEPKDHERVFDIFNKASNNRRAEATGIGLATVKKIVEFYKGKIWLSSELHKGTTVYFTIPA